ncbi:O-antigen ligase family protein [Desulfohalobiaceae bacterium Ax17]|uniref:O-antigen ligase family protein n=1 Tax=Desulfovulcanus ferrireducens TaxID=2831190 RepID=UPI00207B9CC6|nr:O-antigen ligase family protein [Desulfovulcanus ferrireducens]MBT8763333.1 O-antigen ligase family protein [Desulfovulcanus ferrireducens]
MIMYNNLSVKDNIATISYRLMRFFFVFYILFFPLGIAFREIGSCGAAIGLFFYYSTNYRTSNLKKWKLKWIYFIFILYLIVNSFFVSINVHESWYAISHNLYKGFILIFAGIEFIRSPKDLQVLVVAFAIMGFYEGLDGVFQAILGYDLVQGTKLSDWGRLTGSLSTPRVGNLMSLIVPIAAGSYFIIKNYCRITVAFIIYLILLIPPIFLLHGAKARSGWFGFFIAIIAFIYIRYGWNFKKTIVLLLFVASILIFGPDRINIKTLSSAPRLELWHTALKIFTHYPVFGSGFNTYPNAFNKLGIIHQKNSNQIPHPHNIYCQFLAEGGIIGFTLLMLFLFGNLLWSLKKIRLLLEYDYHNYFLIIFFWSSYAGYLMTAFSAHNYFRTWWLGMAMSIIGVVLGGCTLIQREENGN